MGNIQIRPDRALVLRVAREEALAIGADLSDVINMGQSELALSARRSAFVRIIQETGCTFGGLAAVWGCDRQVIGRVFSGVVVAQPSPPPAPVDRFAATRTSVGTYSAPEDQTPQRLAWAHGEDRAALILAGKDAASNADLAAWRGLGRGA